MHVYVTPSSEKSSRPPNDDAQRKQLQAIGRRIIEALPDDTPLHDIAETAGIAIDDFGAMLVGEYRFSASEIVAIAGVLIVEPDYLLTGNQDNAMRIHVCTMPSVAPAERTMPKDA